MLNFLKTGKIDVTITRTGIRMRAESVIAVAAAVIITWIVIGHMW